MRRSWVVALAILAGCGEGRQSRVGVQNDRSTAVYDIEITVSGNTFRLDSLAPGKYYSFGYIPRADDHYVLRFRTATTVVVDSAGYVTSGIVTEDIFRLTQDSVIYQPRNDDS